MATERRPGDWQHRSHKQANTILRDPDAKKWYEDTFWIIFFLVIFWPVGLFLMWRPQVTWSTVVKVIVTLILGCLIAYMWYGYMASSSMA